jgi:hypothetical protein
MKKFLAIVGGICLVLLVVAGIGFAVLAYRGTQLDNESKAYADSALKAITTDWSEKELLDRASPEFKHAATIDQLDRYFRGCSKLGHLQSAEPMKGQSGISIDPHNGKRIQGQYATKAQFENAEATITFGLIKHDGQWQISRFDVQAPGYHPR